MNAFIKLLYAVLIAVSVVMFTSLSIYSFYQPPKSPDYPNYSAPDGDEKAFQKQQDDYNKTYEEFRETEKQYQRNVAFIVLPIAVAFTLFGIVYLKRNEIIGEGLALGGVANTIYGVILASMADQRILRFAAVTLLLASVLVLVQRRFAPAPVKTKKK